jgi:hypothetical protein
MNDVQAQGSGVDSLDYVDSLEPLDRGMSPAGAGPLPPGGCVDGPGPEQLWPYEGGE